jgi:RNA polymerase sigma-70 factor (ECF subfamily)
MNDETKVQHPAPGLGPDSDFTIFMRKYQNMVFTTSARLVKNDAQAEDISQDVFIKAHEHFEMLSTSPTAGGWLKTVATNLSLNHLQRYRNRWRFFSEMRSADASADEAPEVEFEAPDTFFEGIDSDERRAWVGEALAKLPDHQRVPLVLYHFEDIPYDEIARRLGVSLAKVKTDILRARVALAKILSRGNASAGLQTN